MYRAVIETATGNLLRAGFVDFENDGRFDPATETVIVTNPIRGARVERRGRDTVTRFDGQGFVTVPRNLALLKSERAVELRTELARFVETRYSTSRQVRLLFLMDEAIADSLAARVTFIRQLIDWLNLAGDELAAKRAAIQAAATPAAVRAVRLDLATVRAADPNITVRAAQNITT